MGIFKYTALRYNLLITKNKQKIPTALILVTSKQKKNYMIICGNWKYAKAQWLIAAAELLAFAWMKV